MTKQFSKKYREIDSRMSLSQYREKVKRLARERSSQAIFNSTIDHAAIIIESMIETTREEICILSGSLNPRVYGRDEIVSQAQFFLANTDRKMRILVEDFDVTNFRENPFIEEIVNSKNVEIRITSRDTAASLDFHFLVSDGGAYRFEEDKSKASAIASFNDPDGAANLKKIFDQIWNFSSTKSVNLQDFELNLENL